MTAARAQTSQTSFSTFWNSSAHVRPQGRRHWNMLKTKLTTAHIYKTSLNVSYQGFNTAMYTFVIKWLPHNMIEFSEQHSFHFALNSNTTFLYCSGIVIILCFRVDLFCFYHTCKKGGPWTGASLLVSGRGWNEGLVHKGLLLTCESCKATIKDSENKHEQDGSTLRTLLYTRLVTVLPSCGTDGTSVWR